MSYGTIDGVFARYRPISTIVGSATRQVRSIDISSVFIYGAEGLIDGYLARRYSVPVPTTPLINQICEDLAIFNILAEHLPKVPDFMQGRYDRCMKWLEQIACGELVVQSATLASTGDNYAWSSTQGYHPTFSPVVGELNQAPDSDRVDAEFDERSDEIGTSEIC